jgi:predicted dehydrogenase
VIETFEKDEDHFFRFEGRSHHAGEYQNYIEYFAQCLEKGEAPKPDVEEGLVTMGLMQAMEESYLTGKPVKIAEVMKKYGLGELVKA